MKKLSLLAAVFLLGNISISTSYAADCVAPKPGPELSVEEISALYECLQPKLIKGYGKKGHEVGAAYSGWKAASKYPAAPGVHSGQHLMTFVNDIGYEQYTQYNTDGSSMPVGTVIAKESFKIKKNGKITKGPLLMMTKVGESAADTGGWEYTGLKPNGKKLKVDAKGFCHACHQAYPTQDFQGYPVPDARITAN